MHPTCYRHMQLCVEIYMRRDRHYRVVELGSQQTNPNHKIHRTLFEDYDVEYTGLDIEAGRNVDVVMRKPYRVPFKSNSVDVVITGQVFEHIAFPWASFMEISRIVKPGGFIFMTVPSRGHRHANPDAWRYLSDAMRALAAWGRMNLVEAFTDYPPMNGARIAYSEIDTMKSYWGDTVGVFEKPEKPSKLVRLTGEVVCWWANRVGGMSHIAQPEIRPRRRRVHT